MPRQLRVFLCHASQDKPAVKELYQRLKVEAWIDPWLDKTKILPGQDWEMVIEKAVDESDIVIVCLSKHAVNKEGFVQREIRYAYDIALEKPEDTIFLIPLRLDDCNIPRKLRTLHWVDFFGMEKENSYFELIKALKKRFSQNENLEALNNDVINVKVEDFRNLRYSISNIVASLEMIGSKEEIDQDTLKSIKNIGLNSAGRIQRLINTLVDINRLEAGQPIIDMNSVDIKQIINYAIEDVLLTAFPKHFEIVNHVNSSIPHILCDIDMIYRVFVSLFENSAKFVNSERADGNIEVGADLLDKEFVKFWVQVNRIHIALEDLERIFDKSVNIYHKGNFVNLGTGLFFCKLAIIGHGGEIWAESKVDKGHIFSFTLPIANKLKPKRYLQI